jgi:hypothetical protein
MNPARTREVLDKLDIAVEKSNGNVIEIHRTICPGGVLSLMTTERWQLRTTGGIVADAAEVWLAPVVRRLAPLHGEPYKPRGPYWNKTQLKKALRTWRRGE